MPCFREHVERLLIDGRLRQPHSFRLATEAPPEIGDSPPHFRHLVATRRQRKDRMVVGHRDRVTVSEPRRADPVRVQNGGVGLRRTRLQPLEERWPDVEAHRGVQVVPVLDAPVGTEHARARHRRVALAFDALVPVVKRRRARLAIHHAGPWVFARWLVEVAVHHHRSRHARRHSFSESRMLGKMASRTASSPASRRALSSSPSPPRSPCISFAQSEMWRLMRASA